MYQQAQEEHVIIVGNGPSAADLAHLANKIPNPKIIVRLNFFFLEDDAPYGTGVDYFLWAVNRPRLHEELREVVQTRQYDIRKFLCPVPLDLLDYKDGKVLEDPFWSADNAPIDHWATLAEANPQLARVLMSRPLPTAGLQALAYFASQNYKNIHLFGMDFYQSTDKRYGYTIPKDIVADLGSKHTTPGYEEGAHSLDVDLNFLRAILREYPELALSYHGYFDQIDAIIAEPRYPMGPDVSAEAGKEIVRSMTGGRDNRSTLSASDRFSSIAVARLNRLEQENQRLTDRMEELRQDILESNAALFRMIASEGSPHSDVLWVVHETTSLAGVHRPLSAYLEHSRKNFDARPTVIDLSDPDHVMTSYTADYTQTRPHKLVLNSIACFLDTRVEAFIKRATLRAIYLHETEWTLSEFAKENPREHQAFLDFVKTATVFCVSAKQMSYVESHLKPAKAELVYNTVDTMLTSDQRRMRRSIVKPRVNQAALRIGMVGSYQPRKGAQLFADVARQMCAVSSDISFEWVGKHHSGSIDTDAIRFHGPLPPARAMDFIDDIDIMFLPSFDDPQPLAALEALSRGVKLVCYSGIGTAEWIEGISGCAVFSDYTAESAISALRDAVSAAFDYESVDKALAERFEPGTFAQALFTAIEGMDVDLTQKRSPGSPARVYNKARTRMNILALTYDKSEQVWDTISDQVIALRSDPGNVVEYFKLSRKLRNINETDLANQVIQVAQRANSGKASLDREMALYLSEEGEFEAALKHAQKAVSSNPNSAAAQKVMEEIQKAMK